MAYDGTWRDADPAEVQRKMDAGEPYTYRFKVPKGKVRIGTRGLGGYKTPAMPGEAQGENRQRALAHA